MQNQDKPKVDKAALDAALEALKTFDWGTTVAVPGPGKPPQDRGTLKPIDDAVVATHGDAAARKELETKLAAVLKANPSRAAKDFICRKLMIIGTAECVPALAALLADKDNSHMARFALERISAPEAGAAMREALPKVSGALKAGVIGSLGARRDAASVEAIAAALADSDKAVAAAACCALGTIGTAEAAKAVCEFAKMAPEGVKDAAVDGCLACAERLLADGKKADAAAIYKAFAGADQPKHVRQAATRGILAVAGKKE
jgi:HEAT repeat protein